MSEKEQERLESKRISIDLDVYTKAGAVSLRQLLPAYALHNNSFFLINTRRFIANHPHLKCIASNSRYSPDHHLINPIIVGIPSDSAGT